MQFTTPTQALMGVLNSKPKACNRWTYDRCKYVEQMTCSMSLKRCKMMGPKNCIILELGCGLKGLQGHGSIPPYHGSICAL